MEKQVLAILLLFLENPMETDTGVQGSWSCQAQAPCTPSRLPEPGATWLLGSGHGRQHPET